MKNTINRYSFTVQLIVHLTIWLCFFFLPILMPKPPEGFSETFSYFNHLIMVFTCAGFFYLNYFLFIPKLFIKKRNTEYFILIVVVLIVVVTILNFFPIIIHNGDMINKPAPPPFSDDMHNHLRDKFSGHKPGRESFLNIATVIIAFVIWILSTAIRMTNEWYKSEKQKVLIEKEKLNTELAFLKTQVNPHFIFNALNNISSLARKKSDETEGVIITLSNLLRYNLYDSKQDKVYLYKEIQYLNDYIGIQKIRLYENIKINFIVNGNIDIMIEPLLLIPFVENAFKHGVNTSDKGEINILLEASTDSLHFAVKNPLLNSNQLPSNGQHGIGLNNVKRRLNLLYPDKHKLITEFRGLEYIVDLNITFND